MKAALLVLLLPAALAGCLGGEPAAPPLPTGQIDGAVVDHLLRPFANQSVELVQLQRFDATSQLGGFTFRQVPVGFYTLTTRLPDDRTATQVVDVQADKITRVILQLLPVPGPDIHLEARPFQSGSQIATAGAECTVCAWSHEVDDTEHPAEVVLRASWSEAGPEVAGSDDLHLLVSDGDGFPLFDGAISPDARIAIPGTDLQPGTGALHVRVWFGPRFLPRAAFEMESILTLYYGATSDELLHT